MFGDCRRHHFWDFSTRNRRLNRSLLPARARASACLGGHIQSRRISIVGLWAIGDRAAHLDHRFEAVQRVDEDDADSLSYALVIVICGEINCFTRYTSTSNQKLSAGHIINFLETLTTSTARHNTVPAPHLSPLYLLSSCLLSAPATVSPPGPRPARAACRASHFAPWV